MRFFKFFRDCIGYLKSLPQVHILVGIEIDPDAVAAPLLRERVLKMAQERLDSLRREEGNDDDKDARLLASPKAQKAMPKGRAISFDLDFGGRSTF